MNQNEIQAPLLKIGSAWALIGFTSWAEAASFAAFLYSVLLICEWVWKKLAKPALIQLGYIQAPKVAEDE